MIKMPYSDILSKIQSETGVNQDELEMKIQTKCDQLSGLISKEGAAHIVANELGVKLFEKVSGRCKIKEILPGMRDLELAGKVSAVYEVREFQKQEGTGKVGSFMIMDETGTMRIVCWGTQADLIGQMQVGNVIKITGAYVKENQGRKELHCNDRTVIELNPEGENIDVDVSQAPPERAPAVRTKISELAEGQQAELMGAVVQIYDPRFWEACPQCNKRVKNIEGTFNCDAHGEVTPDYSYVMNAFVDDGTGNIRVVFFKNQAQHLTGKTHEEFLMFKDSPGGFESVKHDLLGQMVKIGGRVQKNSMFDRLEFVSQIVDTNPDPNAELN